MKVLLCHNYYQQPGGEDQVFADETALLTQFGHEVQQFTLHNDEIDGMSSWTMARRTLWSRETYQQLRQRLRAVRPDIVHFTNTFPLISPAAYYAAQAEGVPVVQSLHNYRLLCPNAQLLRDGRPCEDCLGKLIAWPGVRHACYRQSRAATAVVAGMLGLHRALGTWKTKVDAYIALAEFSRRKFVEHGLPAARLHVKPNFVHPVPEMGTGEGGYATFVGRLSPEKGIDVLLNAWARLQAPIRLRIVGDGPLADRVRKAAAADNRIEWLGRQPSAEVLRTMSEAACLVMPSIWYEVCPKTLLESLAVGTPVLASRLGAMAEFIDDGRTGRHFTPGDPQDLADQLQRMLGNRYALEAMRIAAREEFLSKYTAQRNYELLIDIYRSVLPAPIAAQLAAASSSEPVLSR